jgi:hypothetical protein
MATDHRYTVCTTIRSPFDRHSEVPGLGGNAVAEFKRSIRLKYLEHMDLFVDIGVDKNGDIDEVELEQPSGEGSWPENPCARDKDE